MGGSGSDDVARLVRLFNEAEPAPEWVVRLGVAAFDVRTMDAEFAELTGGGSCSRRASGGASSSPPLQSALDRLEKEILP